VRKSGAWYTYEGDQLGQGKENARNFLRENPDVANEIEKRIKEKLGVGARLDAADAQADAVKGNGSAPASASGTSAPGTSAAGASASGASASGASASGASASGGSAASGARPNGSAANGASARPAATVPGATV
jgi:recombination protein RecA